MAIDLELVLGFSRDLQRATTLDELVAATNKAVTCATRYRTIWIAALEATRDGEWVRVLAASGTAERLIWEETPRFPVGNDALLLEIRTGRRPVVVEDMRTDPRTDKDLVARTGHRTGINVPLVLGEVVLGALGVASFGDEGVMPPTPFELEHLTVFATLLAAAFDRVRLVEEKRAADLKARELDERNGELEAKLGQAQKMEAIGILAGGIAHDFNNILTVILAHSEIALRRMPGDDPNREAMRLILASGMRAAHLTRNLLTFGRRQNMALRAVSVQEAIHSVLELMRPLLREDIELSLELSTSDLVVMADDTALQQVLMNLVTNGRDAMPCGGVLRICASAFTVDDDFVVKHGGGLLGQCARITVSDTGHGMDAETVAKAFDPFFTTKVVGRGTGLGLATAQAIVHQHGGCIVAESAPGAGTTFSVYLPTTLASVHTHRDGIADDARGGHETILLAEDDAIVRSLLVHILEGHGYRVIEAVDGQDAISKFRRESANIDLVLTDAVMPRGSGLDLYEAVAAFRQSTRIIFMSGYAADVLEQHPEVADGLLILPKPVRPTVLLEAIRRALDEGPAPMDGRSPPRR